MSDSCSNAALPAAKVLAAAVATLARIDERREKEKQKYISEQRLGIIGWFNRKKSDADIWSGTDSMIRGAIEMTSLYQEDSAAGLKLLAEQALAFNPMATINVSAEDFTKIGREYGSLS